MQVFHWLYHSGGVAVLPEDYEKQLQETLARGDIATSFANARSTEVGHLPTP